jgi:hypothetical protein
LLSGKGDKGQWSLTGDMNTARDKHTATLLTSGKVLVTGGSNSDPANYLGSTEVYNPYTNDGEASDTEVYTSVPPAAPRVTTPRQNQRFDTSKPDIAGMAEPGSSTTADGAEVLRGRAWKESGTAQRVSAGLEVG